MEWRGSFHFRYEINKIMFTSPEATVINLVSEVIAGKKKKLIKNPFVHHKLISSHM